MNKPLSISSASRHESIQVLRFVAAALVLATHTTLYLKERASAGIDIWHFGESGVPVFFVISGIVISLSGEKLPHSAHGALAFSFRRFARVVPMYWVATFIKIGATLLVPAATFHNAFDLSYAAKSLLFIPTFNTAGEIRPIHGVGWTLLHEAYFYLVFAAAIRWTLQPAWFTAAFVLASVLLGKWLDPASAWLTVWTSEINLHFVIGILVGKVFTRSRTNHFAGGLKAWGALCAVLGLAVVLPFFHLNPMAMASAAVLPVFNFKRLLRFPDFLVRLGDSSYSLYLFHPFIAAGLTALLGRLFPGNLALVFSGVFIATVIAAHLIYLWVERPLIELTLGLGRRAGLDPMHAR